jgi:chaperone required for assembly of F1-ATPase
MTTPAVDNRPFPRHISHMSDLDDPHWFPGAGDRVDPVAAARGSVKPSLPKRFYAKASAIPHAAGHALALDGRLAHTPAKAPLAVPSESLASAIAAEWEAQADIIDPATMPLTRLVNTALDGVARRRAEVVEETARYAGSDLLCYRAEDPARLVARQAQYWDPILAWARQDLGAGLVVGEGIVYREQPAEALAAVRHAVEAVGNPLALAALSTMTSLTGSVLLALAVAHRRLLPEQAWTAAHVDEDFQMEVWGDDEEARMRRERRWTEMRAAARLMDLLA